jgi:phosphohistidine phosphatase
MELYLLRHGIAADVGPEGSGDAGRPLTEEGIAKIKEVSRGLRSLGVRLDTLLSSPLVRARQTAEIVGRALGLDVELADALAPGCDIARLRELIGEHRGAERVMIVGHEPDFSGLAGDLTGGSRVEFKKGGLARVDLDAVDEGAGMLAWLLPPRALRKIGRD